MSTIPIISYSYLQKGYSNSIAAIAYGVFIILLLSCFPSFSQTENISFTSFQTPPSQYRPYVRWWWNGNQPDSTEIIRELDLLKEAGIGGVEINPIAMPEEIIYDTTKSIKWLSPQWNQMLKTASFAAKNRGMKTDLIVGSGWPSGGNFLKPQEHIKKLEIFEKNITNKKDLDLSIRQLLKKLSENNPDFPSGNRKAGRDSLVFIKLFPLAIKSVNEVIDLTSLSADVKLKYHLKPGKYKIVYGIVREGYMEVKYGVSGANGPAMDHFKEEVTLDYISRLMTIEKDLDLPLSQLIRALFYDSIELDGANWTSDISNQFKKINGYRLEPYLPFLYLDTIKNDKFQDTIRRVKYDFNRTLVQIFSDQFIQTFQNFCSDNDILCRYQAYGNPWLYGLLEGYLIPDIPEGNNWINTNPHPEKDHFDWNQHHGYMIWNKYASSAAHLKGKKIVSCEAMTRTQNVFKTSLADIKIHDDMNFITGINHSILHGFNYSPPEVGFPGWMRFGTFFSEYNTWWPYLKKWTDYNTRLNYIFQNSQSIPEIAILGPTADIWSKQGLEREAFHQQPGYLHKLWEPISEIGSSCDYISEEIIQGSHFKNGNIQYGPMTYKLLIITEVTSMQPKTAEALLKFAQCGGKIIFVKQLPNRSPSFINAKENDQLVSELMEHIIKFKNVRVIAAPSNNVLLEWIYHIFEIISFSPQLQLINPTQGVYQLTQSFDNGQVSFFTNTNSEKIRDIQISTDQNKEFYLWNPETGKRSCIQSSSDGKLWFQLQSYQSTLLVYKNSEEISLTTDYQFTESKSDKEYKLKPSEWKLQFSHINGKTFNRSFDELKDITKMNDSLYNQFSGTISYTCEFKLQNPQYNHIDLGNINDAITEVWLNGEYLGVKWYGHHSYFIKNALKEDVNEITIKYTSTLSNYCRSLSDNPTAYRWAHHYEVLSVGLTKDILLY